MRRIASWLVLVIGLVTVWLVTMFMLGARGAGWLILMTVVYGLSVAMLVLAARRVTARGWLVAGLIILAGLFVPTAVLIDNFGSPSSPYETVFQITVFLLPSIALILAAVLLYSGFDLLADRLNPAANAQVNSTAVREASERLAVACFVTSGLLILKTLHNLYWLMAWDSMDNGLEYFWIVVPVLVAVFSGVMLAIKLRRWTVLAGLGYLLLVPCLIVAVSVRAKQRDFRQLTEARAGQVSQLVEAYYAREGHYPQNLRQVKPWYVSSLPGPFIMYGQDWCYEGGEDYYRLGYVYREHWSSPELIRRVYKTAGEPPDSDSICAEEIEALIQREPFFYEK
jgi:peptidoglycan/LPS O-acetylase OafA/YrhL